MKITLNDLPELRKNLKDKKIVFCSGSFDLTHVGHILFLEDCKKLGDILIVGVGGDISLRKNKGDKRPIFNEKNRLKIIDSLKPVDYCFIDDISHKGHPLSLIDFVFEKLKPDVYAINEDAFDIPYREKISRKFNIKLIILKRWFPKEFGEPISTTNLIEEIKKL